MWRAYGDTALVINSTPMMESTDLLAVHSTPVSYLSEKELINHVSGITYSITKERSFLQKIKQEEIIEYIYNMLFLFAIASKHPGFEEEKELRLFYSPNIRKSPIMTEEIVVLDGIPQKIFKLQLKHDPNNGLHGADIPSLLDRIIIGPTEFPYVTYNAFVSELERLGVANAASKVIVSDIPLRSK